LLKHNGHKGVKEDEGLMAQSAFAEASADKEHNERKEVTGIAINLRNYRENIDVFLKKYLLLKG
jgi:hypothetical protein